MSGVISSVIFSAFMYFSAHERSTTATLNLVVICTPQLYHNQELHPIYPEETDMVVPITQWFERVNSIDDIISESRPLAIIFVLIFNVSIDHLFQVLIVQAVIEKTYQTK